MKHHETSCHIQLILTIFFGWDSQRHLGPRGSPWTLPERGPLHDDATVQEMLGEDEWQALGETLQKLGTGGKFTIFQR
jgi:hypothetical protein